MIAASFAMSSPSAAGVGDDRWTQAELEAVSEVIRGDVEKMRGMTFKRPVQVKVTDKAGFLDYMKKRQELTQSAERLARDETVAKMLGLIPHDMDLMSTVEEFLKDQVGGFYDPSSDTFFLMDSFTGDLAKIILAHELTHALDDQIFDIDGTLKRMSEETDAEFAFQAVVEGSGTAAMNQWTVTHLKDLDREALLGAQDLGTAGLADAPPYLWKPLIAAYLRGDGFLTRSRTLNISMKAAKVDDIRRAFEHPPRSSEQILHPEKYWDEESRDDPRSVKFETSARPKDWEVLGEDTLGEIMLALLTTPLKERTGLDVKNPLSILGIAYTNTAAEGWGGDRLLLLGKGKERWLELVTVWDSTEDAEQFREAVAPLCTSAIDVEGLPFAMQILPHERSDAVVIRATKGSSASSAPAIGWSAAATAPAARER
jgi:hypothetical protein